MEAMYSNGEYEVEVDKKSMGVLGSMGEHCTMNI